MTQEELLTPVSEEDVIDLGDYIESIYETQISFYRRVQAQAGVEHPVTQEMWNICLLMRQSAERLAELRRQGCFTPQDHLPVSKVVVPGG
jgi:hypothetical protein